MFVVVLIGTHAQYLEHDSGTFHPESPSRITAVLEGVRRAGLEDQLRFFTPTEADPGSLEAVHAQEYLINLQRFCVMGGGAIDSDTTVSDQSFRAAVLAAGAGLDAIKKLQAGEADSAFLVVRPPGHHATSSTAMGFCLINNVAVSVAHLVSQGNKVAVIDFDAHHGNGTQDVFYQSDKVLYVSTHQHPLYPGTGRVQELGAEDGFGYTVNLPVPEGSSGETVRAALEIVAQPVIELFSPDWIVISAGFDGHYKDPLTNLGLTAKDFYEMTSWATSFVRKGHTLVFLEGGYDLDALRDSTTATLGALAGELILPKEDEVRGKVSHETVESLAESRKRALGDRDPYLGTKH
ncbi:Acetoin utilization deacetylase AcuC [Ferrithrix thermotolerans DSM 19514]|uniref:Acetoin utilization deacetylase AcuC n=1 Tax=Ferrithrix thermotolerans DSM 19514 TaxID=1121881 RepID=A0A1M4WZC1_9ACTN|nr:Acetoin utilization deacetylase AcuC [Ferrithrix thermotolerans DSM 19514]